MRFYELCRYLEEKMNHLIQILKKSWTGRYLNFWAEIPDLILFFWNVFRLNSLLKMSTNHRLDFIVILSEFVGVGSHILHLSFCLLEKIIFLIGIQLWILIRSVFLEPEGSFQNLFFTILDLFLKLSCPFCEDPQDRWVSYIKYLSLDLFLGV